MPELKPRAGIGERRTAAGLAYQTMQGEPGSPRLRRPRRPLHKAVGFWPIFPARGRVYQVLHGEVAVPRSLVACAQCGKPFSNSRRNRRFCEERCRKAAHKAEARARDMREGLPRPTQVRRTTERVESAENLRTCYVDKLLVSRASANRFLEELIHAARDGNSKLRDILTNPILRSPEAGRAKNKLQRRLTFPTIGELANSYTWQTWGCSIRDAVEGEKKTPPAPRIELKCHGQVQPARQRPGVVSTDHDTALIE